MAKGTTSNPTVRILVIGTAGAGKNCLESRFTTSHYPPPYDPSLTLCSRRFLALEPKPPGDCASPASVLPGLHVTTDPRGSTPSLLPPPGSAGPATPMSDPVSPISFASTTSTVSASTTSTPTSCSFGNEPEPPIPEACAKCARSASTYLVEVVNYPALQSAKVRQHVLVKGDYDAVLLAYDISDRRSFDRIKDFHAEVSLFGRGNGAKSPRRPRSHAPRRHSGLPVAVSSSMPKRISVMSSFTPGGGLAGSSEGEEAGKGAGGGVVVALVGNKADIGNDGVSLSEGTEGGDGLVDPDDDFDDDCESAIAVFGDLAYRDLHERQGRLGGGLSALGTTGRLKPSDTKSSETVERWLQIIGRAAEDDGDSAHDSAALTTSVSKAKSARSVSRAEGEDVARSLNIQVPFFETSAKTGVNVEEAFESIVREVLRQMGHTPTPSAAELAGVCRDRHEAEQRKRAGASRSSRSVDRLAPTAGLGRGQGIHGRLVRQTRPDAQGRAAHLERPVSMANSPAREDLPRRESFLGRMRRILMSGEVSSGEGARGPTNSYPASSS